MIQSYNRGASSYDNLSALYNVEPLGINTPFVESLTGYIERISEAHGLSVSELFRELIFPNLNKHYTNVIAVDGGNGFYNWAYTINGLGKSSAEFVGLFENWTTRRDINSLTMMSFRNVIPSRGLLRKDKSWCPVCYQEMKDQGQVYDQLIWMIKSNTVCPKHHVRLQDRCPECSRLNNVLERRSRPGFCSKCSNWMGSDSSNDEIDEWSLRKAFLISELLSNHSKPEVLSSTVVSNIKGVVESEAGGKVSLLAKIIKVPKSTLWGWYSGDHLPPMEEVLRICSQFNISVSDFYGITNVESKRNIIISKRTGMGTAPNKILDFTGVKKKLIEIVSSSSTELISVKTVALEVKCSKKTLYKYWGDMCKKQAKKYKRNSRIRRDLRYINILSAALKQKNKNDYLPINYLENTLGKPAVFRERQLREVWREIEKKVGTA